MWVFGKDVKGREVYIKIMKSPFTGKEMKVVYENRTWNFRGEKYEYIHAAWLCADTREKFTTDELDDAGFAQVTNQYRTKYGIPFTDEIVAIREKYGLSAAKMSQILGIGTNQWRNYECGEVPNVSNGRMIRSIMNPKVFLDYVDSSKNVLAEKEYNKFSLKIASLVEECDKQEKLRYDISRVYQCERGVDNGFAQQSLDRLKNALLYILNQCGEVFYTKMNKLLFYTDFLAYRRFGMALTGLSYRAIEFGPVPERWDRVYSQFDEIVQEPRSYGDKEGCVLFSTVAANTDIFTTDELEVLNEVCSKFSECSSTHSFLDEVLHHFFCYCIVRNNPLTKRSNRYNVTRSSTKH